MTEATTSPAAPDEPTKFVTDKLADFPDRLSPMLVKELRQGLRAKTFVIVFLTLQALLGLILLASLGASGSPQEAGHFISGIIFMFFSLAVLVIQPIRGIGTLHREVQGNTIELMVLTRLSAWKIVLGKWISLVAQSALLLAAVIPYLILRYWFGDMNLFGELVLLLLVFLFSAIATAIVVGISCLPSVIIRGLAPLITAAIGLFAIPALCFEHEFQNLVTVSSMQTSEDFWGILTLVLSGCYVGWTALGLGASQIAPAAENHSTPKRLITIALLLLLLVVAVFAKPNVYYLLSVVLVLGIPALVMALNEPISLLPPICTPFLKRGKLGVVAGRFLYPGWPSGAVFSALFVGLAFILINFCSNRNLTTAESTAMIAALSSLIMPAAILSFFDKKIRHRFTFYLLIVVSQFVLTLILIFVADALPAEQRGFLWFFSWIPMVSFAMSEMSRQFDPSQVWMVTLSFCALYGLVLLINSLIRLRSIREVERDCLEHLNPES
ncbi:hypothetical protein [Haloferula sp.]|uniref:hypothetical protein n=1 Tax=Haloferula sp. TaxID=2497595 RepID=UPI00329DB372